MSLEKRIIKWIKDYTKKSETDSLVIGVSGGIDSALTSTLCAMTGAKTILVSLPIHQNLSHLDRANKHISFLKNKFSNVESKEIDLTKTFDSFSSLFETKNKLAEANSRSRLRMLTLYHIATMKKGLVVGTGNKVEDFGIGFYTKYGDGGVDISPIADLMKSEVRDLAKSLNIIDEIIKAKPSDGLWDDSRSDEDQIGASYEELEWAMNFNENKIVGQMNKRQQEVLKIYKKFNSRNKHKMIPIPIFKK
jgi:NAD+ synthase